MSPQQTHKEISHMLQKHITINELTNIHIYFLNGINANNCSKLMGIGKDKAYYYFRLFKEGLTVIEIFEIYKKNKSKCGRKKKLFSQDKQIEINQLLDKDWSVDAICGRDKLINYEERCCTKTLYRMVKDGVFSIEKLRRKGRRKKNHQKETRGKINDCKSIHERDIKFPKANLNIEFGHFEGDTIIGEKKQSAIVTLVEKQTKYIVLLKASRKSGDVYNALEGWLKTTSNIDLKTIVFDRGKEFSKWREIEALGKCEVYFSDPGSPGQRGLNENSNGIVRKDLPKSTDLSKYSQKELNDIANKWNRIPRKSLDYFSPSEILEMATGKNQILPVA